MSQSVQEQVAGLKRLASAVIRQSHADLSSSCRRMRVEGAEFFTSHSPWLALLGVNPAYMQQKLRIEIARALTDPDCHQLSKPRKDKTRRCLICSTIFDANGNPFPQEEPI